MSDKPTPTFYLFHGEDDLTMDEALDKLRAGMGDNGAFNTTEFDGQNASVPEIINAVTSFPFLADKRLVIVRGLVAWITRKGAGEPGKKAIAYLKDNVPNLPDFARLVLVERKTISAGNAVMKLAEKTPTAFVRAFSVPGDTTTWIIKRTRQYDAEIDQRAAVALADVIADDLRRADNEIVKLVSYVDGERTINEDDVATLTPYVAEANIFKIVDAIVDGRGQFALALLHRLLADKNEDPIRTFGMIVRQFRLLLLAREHLDAGGNAGEMAGAINVRPWQAQNLARQVRGFDMDQLERIYRRLQNFDQGMKTGEIKPVLALDLFIAGIAR